MSEHLKTKVQQLFDEVLNKGNLEKLDKIAAPDIFVHNTTNPDLEGIDQVKAFHTAVSKSWPDMNYTIDEIIFEGDDSCAVRYTMEATHSVQLQTLPIEPTGNKVSVQACDIYHWEAGKITEIWTYNDFLEILRQLEVELPVKIVESVGEA